tara:strand:+ start:1777 stop:2430 length:654 start_codon:yes stop_codon:yes gene_type:complete
MSEKINFKLFKPFGSTIAKAELPLELIKDFKDDLKSIKQDKEKQKNHNWGKRLVGAISEEYLISPEIMLKWKRKFFDPIIASYFNAHFKNQKVKSILINSAWYVCQKSGEYNPLHNHCEYIGKNYHLSCVGYLALPESMKSTKSAKEHNDFSGEIEFVEGSENMFTDCRYRVKPEVRQWFLFPNSLNHIVYAFDSDKNEERISFSFNATINFEENIN